MQLRHLNVQKLETTQPKPRSCCYKLDTLRRESPLHQVRAENDAMSMNSIQNGRDHLVALSGKSTNLLVYRHLLTVFLLVLSLFWMIRARESAIDFLRLDSPHVSPGVRYRHFFLSSFQDHWMGDDQLWLEAVPAGSTIGFQVPTRALGTRRLEITYTVARDHGRSAILLPTFQRTGSPRSAAHNRIPTRIAPLVIPSCLLLLWG